MNRNMFPIQIISKEIENYLKKKNSKTEEEKKSLEEKKISYFKLPYFENLSESTRKKLSKIANDLCNKTDIHLSFSTCKIGSLFSAKDKLKNILKSFVVYQFTCAGCNASYIGETTRHLITRIEEHFSSQSSHIKKHLDSSPNCKNLCDESCFKIIDESKSQFSLKLKEAMHIEWKKPTLNIQQKTVQLTISL